MSGILFRDTVYLSQRTCARDFKPCARKASYTRQTYMREQLLYTDGYVYICTDRTQASPLSFYVHVSGSGPYAARRLDYGH